jgi:thiol-disulfide isomerase/thioredoxin
MRTINAKHREERIMRRRTCICTLWIAALAFASMCIIDRTRAGAQDAAAGAPGGQQEATISGELAEVERLAAAGDTAGASTRCRRILELAAASTPDTLTGRDWYGIGTAHYYLMAEAFDKALQAGGLDTERGDIARQWCDHVYGASTQPAVQVVGKGERVNLGDYVVRGKTTIFDFHSEYCPPCRAIAPALEKLAQQRPDVVVVKVDINRPGARGIDWGSPTAKQFGLRSIPHFKIYGPDGRLKAEDRPAYTMVRQMITAIGR